ncbi:hypothetical protein [Caulobacter sp.]|uniref:hypothetical protein n=1 Tax=Caulobacter sp. TaxID=78 RepID=UPI0031DD265F
MQQRTIAALLNTATAEMQIDGVVNSHTEMLLAAEGYDLSVLERDIEQRMKTAS